MVVNKTTPTLTPPTSSVGIGWPLSSGVLSGGAATNAFNNSSVPGSFAYTEPTLVPKNLGPTNVNVTFTPTDLVNYNSTTTTVTVNVNYGLLAVFGTSVAKGVGSSGYINNLTIGGPSSIPGGSYSNSWAADLTTNLWARGRWSVTNDSWPGDNSGGTGGQPGGINRMITTVVPQSPNYVFIGYSLGNDNLGNTSSNAATVVANFTTNLTTMITQARTNGMYPVTILCYARDDIQNANRYSYLQAMNLAINSWNIPSVNFDGAIDNGMGGLIGSGGTPGGSGAPATGVQYGDGIHPNDYGHNELYLTIPPTLFEAIALGKTNSPYLAAVTNFARLTQNTAVTAPITFIPTNTVHSFTMSFRVRTTNNGTIATIRTGGSYATLQITNGQFIYFATNGGQIVAGGINANNGDWHDVAISFRYALTNTWLFVDGAQAGNLTEQFVTDQFVLGGPGASGATATPATVDFQNWCLYRSAWNLGEAQAQMNGQLQQASMEIGAMLDDASFASNSPAANRAQSLSVAQVNTPNLAAMQSVTPPSNLAAQSLSSTSVRLTWTRNSTTETGFVIERRLTGSSSWSQVAVAAAGSTSYTNSGLAAGVSYDYRVAAQENGLPGNYSNISPVTTGVGMHQTILVDFGPNNDTEGVVTTSPDWLGQYWNNVVGTGLFSTNNPALSYPNLMTTANSSTTIGLNTSASGWTTAGITKGGLTAPSYSLLGNFAVSSATVDYFFTGTSASLALTNLNPTLNYRLRLFGTRLQQDGSTRVTRYITTGGNGSITNDLITTGTAIGAGGYNGNNNTIISVSGIVPDANNQIQVVVTTNSSTAFAYLGIMEITANHSPVAKVMTVTRTAGLPLIISLSDIATNWSDVDGDAVTLTGVTMQSTNGVNLFPLNWSTNLDGSIVTANGYAYIGYTNSPNVNDQISYRISDGFGGTNLGYVNIVIQSSVTGTNSITAHDFTSPYSNTITAYGIPNFYYVLERATNLTSPVWVNVQTNQANATNGVINAADTFWDLGGVKPSPSAFYQLKWQP